MSYQRILQDLLCFMIGTLLLIDPNYGMKFGAPKGSGNQDRSCVTQRNIALQRSQEIAEKLPGTITNLTTVMIPSCESDGSWTEVQCHPATSYCWCVTTNDGRPIPQTSVQNKRPKCGDDDDEEDDDVADGAESCTDTERAVFTSDLIKELAAEFEKVTEDEKKRFTSASRSVPGMSEDSAKITYWKFTTLDGNGDGELSSKELRSFKREVKKSLKPKRCSKTFLDYCDKNTDLTITLNEWNTCLGTNSNISFRQFLLLNSDNPQENMRGWTGDILPILDQSPSSEPKEERRTPELMEHQKRLFDMLSAESNQRDEAHRRNAEIFNGGSNDRIDRSPLNNQQDSLNRDLVSLSKKTCNDERRSGLSKSNPEVFLPSCQQDGRYDAKQCHNYTGYCWCVDVNSGVPIPGTSKKKEDPGCGNIQIDEIQESREDNPYPTLENFNNQIDNAKRKKKGEKGRKRKHKEIPGCPDPHHSSFIQQLTDVLTREMAASGTALPAELSSNSQMSLEEKAIRFKFMNADKNKDQKLSKKEMRFARHLVKENTIKSPEKCGKRFMKFCDRDKDKFVSMDELLICTEVRKKNRRRERKKKNNGVSSIDDYLRRTNTKNPFTEILRPS